MKVESLSRIAKRDSLFIVSRHGMETSAQSERRQPVTLSVLIVSWNNWAKLNVCLSSIYSGTVIPSEIIVIDNDSKDGTPLKLEQTFPEVKLHRNDTNIGHTKGVNLGLRQARGEYVLVLDHDTELAPDCIDRMLEFMRARKDVEMVAPRTFNTDGTVQESARNFPGILSGLFGRQSTLTRILPDNLISKKYLARDFIDSTEPFPVEQIGGACMLFRHSLLDRIGPWDERYIGYWVDTDWCKSVGAENINIYCVPSAHLIHHEGNARHKRKTPHRIWIFHRGAYQYYTKWHTRGTWDPRSIFAGIMLAARALLQIATNGISTPSIEETPNRPAESANEIRGSSQ
jgi:N-acetylglucosaminyl-diphospho-decaprenol L-rhamnosyltransferase